MIDLFEWPILIILVANALGLLLTLLITFRLHLSIIFLIVMLAIFGGTILLNVYFPGMWWSGMVGYTTSLVALFLLVGYISAVNEEKKQTRGLSAEDQAVTDDFIKWASGQDIGQKKEVSGFGAYASRDRSMVQEVGPAIQNRDPVCPNCGSVYNREVVISQIKQQSPEIFDFQTWTTKFVCKQCRHEIVISGSQGG